jgi:hypothetical protein
LLIGQSEVKFLRYTFPLYLGVAGGFGWAMAAAHRRKGFVSGIAAIGLLGLGGETPLAGLRGAAAATAWMVGDDPRDQAAKLLQGQQVSVGLFKDPWFYTPPFYPDTGLPRPAFVQVGADRMRTAERPRVTMLQPNGPLPEYVAFSSFEVEAERRLSRFRSLGGPEQAAVEQYKSFQDLLDANYRLHRAYGGIRVPLPHDLQYIRPTIWLWKRSDLP